jgi:hypothetical protein
MCFRINPINKHIYPSTYVFLSFALLHLAASIHILLPFHSNTPFTPFQLPVDIPLLPLLSIPFLSTLYSFSSLFYLLRQQILRPLKAEKHDKVISVQRKRVDEGGALRLSCLIVVEKLYNSTSCSSLLYQLSKNSSLLCVKQVFSCRTYKELIVLYLMSIVPLHMFIQRPNRVYIFT